MSEPREYELKLETDPENALRMSEHPALAPSGSKTDSLTSVYFDTEDLRLREAGVFLRVRQINDRYIFATKIAEGKNGRPPIALPKTHRAGTGFGLHTRFNPA
jgi:triphosphatase